MSTAMRENDRDDGAVDRDARGRGGAPVQPSGAHWLVAGIGAAVLAGLVATLLYFEFAGGSAPPALEARVEAVHPAPGGHSVLIEVRNTGAGTAAEVTIRGVLAGEAGEEESEVVLDYVPPGSSRRATLLFEADPAAGTLEVRAVGYREP